MAKILQACSWTFVLIGLLMLPYVIPVGHDNLMAWQHEHLGWNYVGVSANYIVFAVYAAWSKKSFAHFGLHIGNWKQHLLWFAVLTVLFLLLMRGTAFLTEGPLAFQIPLATTVFFQFIFVAFGEELFWRGMMQSEFGLWTAIAGFAVLHVIPNLVMHFVSNTAFAFAQGAAAFVFAAIFGLVLGWVRCKTGSVYPKFRLKSLEIPLCRDF